MGKSFRVNQLKTEHVGIIILSRRCLRCDRCRRKPFRSVPCLTLLRGEGCPEPPLPGGLMTGRRTAQWHGGACTTKPRSATPPPSHLPTVGCPKPLPLSCPSTNRGSALINFGECDDTIPVISRTFSFPLPFTRFRTTSKFKNHSPTAPGTSAAPILSPQLTQCRGHSSPAACPLPNLRRRGPDLSSGHCLSPVPRVLALKASPSHSPEDELSVSCAMTMSSGSDVPTSVPTASP